MSVQRINKQWQCGFTLVELVAVIVLLGIISTGVTAYIRTSVEAYGEVVRRNEIAQIGRFAIERMSRELRSALPGSVRISGNCIEFVPVLAATTYIDIPVAGFSAAADDFSVVNFSSAGGYTRAVVYTLAPSDVYATGSNFNLPIDTPAVLAGNILTFDFSSPPQQFAEHSPVKKIYFVDRPVSFCVVGTNLNRYSAYNYSDTQPVLPASGGSLLAEFIEAGTTFFDYSTGTLQRNGIVHLDFQLLARGSTDERVRFSHDVALQGEP